MTNQSIFQLLFTLTLFTKADPSQCPPGAPCQPFSRMGLGLGEGDPKFLAHLAFYEQAPMNATIQLLENVPEYQLKSYVKKYLGSWWEVHEVKVDPRLWGFGNARPRVYGVAWDTRSHSWDDNFPFEAILESLKARPVMTSSDFFWMDLPPSQLTWSQDLWLSIEVFFTKNHLRWH